MRIEKSVLQLTLLWCYFVWKGTCAFQSMAPRSRQSSVVLFRRRPRPHHFPEEPTDPERKKEWLVSNERFSPENLQRPPEYLFQDQQDRERNSAGGGAPNETQDKNDIKGTIEETNAPHTGFREWQDPYYLQMKQQDNSIDPEWNAAAHNIPDNLIAAPRATDNNTARGSRAPAAWHEPPNAPRPFRNADSNEDKWRRSNMATDPNAATSHLPPFHSRARSPGYMNNNSAGGYSPRGYAPRGYGPEGATNRGPPPPRGYGSMPPRGGYGPEGSGGFPRGGPPGTMGAPPRGGMPPFSRPGSPMDSLGVMAPGMMNMPHGLGGTSSPLAPPPARPLEKIDDSTSPAASPTPSNNSVDKSTTGPSMIEDATVTRSGILAEHQDLRLVWDNAEEKRQVEQEAQTTELQLKKKFKQAIEEANRVYKEGLDKCLETKQRKLAKLNKDTPDATVLAVGIAKMSNALRKMKDGSPEKRALEVELNLWQDCYDRAMEQGDEQSQGR